jgi:hypothetical protein
MLETAETHAELGRQRGSVSSQGQHGRRSRVKSKRGSFAVVSTGLSVRLRVFLVLIVWFSRVWQRQQPGIARTTIACEIKTRQFRCGVNRAIGSCSCGLRDQKCFLDDHNFTHALTYAHEHTCFVMLYRRKAVVFDAIDDSWQVNRSRTVSKSSSH